MSQSINEFYFSLKDSPLGKALVSIYIVALVLITTVVCFGILVCSKRRPQNLGVRGLIQFFLQRSSSLNLKNSSFYGIGSSQIPFLLNQGTNHLSESFF